jgi:hypothetical protein
MKNIVAKTALTFAVLGYIFSSRYFILFLNNLDPVRGLIFYYFQIFVTLEVLQYFGLVIGGVKMTSITQTIGELLIIFAFFIIVDNESEWIQVVVKEEKKEEQNCPQVYLQAEDGAAYYFWKLLTNADPDTLRILTFVVTPALLVSIGLLLTGGVSVRRELLA